ncbi:alpha/beta hydrolase, partial [Nocardia sp. NPDC050193]
RPSTKPPTTLNSRQADRRWSETEAGPQPVTVQPLRDLGPVLCWGPLLPCAGAASVQLLRLPDAGPAHRAGSGYDGAEDIGHVFRVLAARRAALRYYRNNLQGGVKATFTIAPKAPALYLHGDQDGCMQAALQESFPETLPAGSRYERIAGAGHFLQLENPTRVTAVIKEWIGAPRR